MKKQLKWLDFWTETTRWVVLSHYKCLKIIVLALALLFSSLIGHSALHSVGAIDWMLVDEVIGKLRYEELILELSNMLMNYSKTLASYKEMTF